MKTNVTKKPFIGETSSLIDLCDAIVDCPHSTPKWTKNGKLVIRNYNIKNGKLDLSHKYFTDEATFNNRIKRIKPQPGDLIITREAPMGEVCIIPNGVECCLGQRMVLIRPNSTLIDNNYLLYTLMSEYVQMNIKKSDNSGSIVSNLCIPDLEKLRIPITSIENQKKIAHILSDLDAKTEINNRINSDLESITKTLYDYWFVQFDFPDENGNPYKSSGGKMVWNEQLKCNVPDGWEVKTLSGMVEFERGISYTSKEIEQNNGMPMINLASIDIYRNYRPNELKYFSGKYKDSDIIKNGDMLIACTDLTRNADIIGSPIFVPNKYEKYLYSMDLAKIKIISDELVILFLFMTLRTSFYHNYIKYFASGTNVLHLNLDGILWYPVAIPPKKLQLQFSNLIKSFINEQSDILNENQKLSEIRDWLLPLLMNGQVTINKTGNKSIKNTPIVNNQAA